MPFTLAHPAAVLPLRRIPALQTVSLVVGSVTPDLPYFVPGRIARWMVDTHTLTGSVVTDVPLGMLVLLAIFLLRRPLTELLSCRARCLVLSALEHFARRPESWLLAPFSVLVGVWTHLLWDSFTHSGGWAVQHLSLLRTPVTIGWYTGELCHILQYLSSVLGLTLLWVWYVAHAPNVPRGTERWSDRVPLVLVSVAAVVIGCAQAAQPAHGQPTYRIFYLLLTRTIGWFGLLYLLAGTWRMWSRRLAPELGSASS
jgi:hypothetical protein